MQSKILTKGLIFAFILAQFVLIGFLRSQARNDEPQQEELRYDVTVTVKLIQVYVTDKKGNPITDLTKSDFEIYDDGKPQPVSHFERYVQTLHGRKAGKREPAPAEIPSRMSQKFFLFFDFAFNCFGGIAMAKRAAFHFIDTQLDPSDEVGVLSYSNQKGLLLHEHLTTNHSKIREVIKEVGMMEATGRAGMLLEELQAEKDAKIDWVKPEAAKPRNEDIRIDMPEIATLHKEAKKTLTAIGGKTQYQHEVLAFSSAVKDLAEALRYIPGYKHVILFSTGVPNFLMYQIADQIAPQIDKMNLSASDGLNLRLRYEAMSRELASSNTPVLAVNVEGLSSRFREQNFEESSPYFRKQTDPLRFIDRAEKRDSALREMAKISGGKYFGDINDYEKIVEEIQKLTSSYYVLGYNVDEKWDGKYHKIKVKIKRSGCKVYAQRGYFNPKPFSEYTELERKLHLLDLALSERPHFEEPIHFALLALPCSFRGKSTLAVVAKIPLERMKEVLGKETEIVTLVFDERKNIIDHRYKELDASQMTQGNIYYCPLSSLYPGHFDCRVILRNLEAGKAAVASSFVDIPEKLDSGIRLYPPLLLFPGKEDLYLDASDKKQREEARGMLSLVNVYPFDLTQYVPLVDEVGHGLDRLLVAVRCSVGDVRPPEAEPSEEELSIEIEFSARLIDLNSGDEAILSPSLLQNYQDEDDLVYLLELQMGELRPSRYSLYLFAKERNTQSVSFVSSTFTVK